MYWSFGRIESLPRSCKMRNRFVRLTNALVAVLVTLVALFYLITIVRMGG